MNQQFAMDPPLSLIACCCAVVLIIGALFFGLHYAENLEQKYIHAIAPLYPDSVINGSVLQKTALNNADLLPVYGASEEHKEDGSFQASQFFQNYPTGFAPFDAAKGGARSLTEAITLASVGENLAGKKVIISFTPAQFVGTAIHADVYAGLFTELHATELVFSPWLSYSTKQLAAKRMQSYPETLEGNPLLAFAVDQLARNTAVSKVLYYLIYSLGRLQADIMELQDHYQSVTYILQNQKLLNPNVNHIPATIDWQADLATAHAQAQQQSDNNIFGFSHSAWLKIRKKYHPKPVGTADDKYLRELKTSVEADDFALMLQILKELGARPMLVGRPINDKYYNYVGISDNALNNYYTEVESIAARYNMPIADFKDFQNDIYFGIDRAPHTSQEGWVYVDQVYNNFYHETAQ